MRVAFPRLSSNPEAEGRRRPKDEAPFVRECRRAIRNLPRSSDLSRSRKELYRGLVVGSASDPLVKLLGWSMEKIRSQWNWAPGSGFLNNFDDWDYRACLADMPDCLEAVRHVCGSSLEGTTLHAFYHCERVRPFWSHVEEWTARISPRQLVLLDVGYVFDNIDPPFQGEKRVVFLVILAVARMVIWQTQNKGLYEGENFSHRDLILFFRHQSRVKIKCDRRRIQQTVGAYSKPGRMQGGNIGVILLSSTCAWRRWSRSFGTPPRISRIF